jgi:membrane-associated phospholipid phosphatase
MTSLIERVLSLSGIVLLLAVVLALVLGYLLRPARDPRGWPGQGTRLRQRFPGQIEWLAARFRPGVPTGRALTAAVFTLAVFAWALGSLTFSVVHDTGIARADPRVLAFFVGHRTAWLTSIAKVLTWLGSSIVLWPVVIAAGLGLWWRRRRWLPAVLPALALAGAWAGGLLIKGLVARPRPPAGAWLTVVHGWSYPSQHAAQALATWGMLAFTVMMGRRMRARVLLSLGAILIALVVGLTRLYLAAHWLTDVLGGWALAGVWDSLLIICYLLTRQSAQAPLDRRGGPGDAPRSAGDAAAGRT